MPLVITELFKTDILYKRKIRHMQSYGGKKNESRITKSKNTDVIDIFRPIMFFQPWFPKCCASAFENARNATADRLDCPDQAAIIRCSEKPSVFHALSLSLPIH